jgi:hypothetical protein
VPVPRTLLLAGVAAFAATATVAVAVHDAHDRQGVAVAIDAAHPGRVIPRSFVGFSLELPAVARYAGTAARPNRAFAALLATLAAAQGSPPALRIGGNSSDESWWAPGHQGAGTRPRIARYRVGRRWLARLRWLARVGHGPVTVGVNLAANDPARALAFARAVRAALPRGVLRTIEIGNEPDLYTRSITFRTPRVVVRRAARRARYDQSRYAADVRRYAAVLAPALGREPALDAGGFAGVAWDAALAPLLRAERGRVGALSAHAYPLDGCPPHASRATQLHHLLSDAASRGLAAGVARMVAIGRRAGVPVTVTEMNSATCGGVPGISDTFASALWAPSALFAMAQAGVAGVDLHAWPGAPYAPFALTRAREEAMRAQPLYYGLLLFAGAAGHGSRLLPTRLTTDTGVRVWATLARRGAVRVVAVNPSADRAARVTVTLRGVAPHPAALRLMRSRGLHARGDVSLGGRVIGADGRLRGRDRALRVVPVGGGYVFSLPAASAGLLTVAPGTGPRLTGPRRPKATARNTLLTQRRPLRARRPSAPRAGGRSRDRARSRPRSRSAPAHAGSARR